MDRRRRCFVANAAHVRSLDRRPFETAAVERRRARHYREDCNCGATVIQSTGLRDKKLHTVFCLSLFLSLTSSHSPSVRRPLVPMAAAARKRPQAKRRAGCVVSFAAFPADEACGCSASALLCSTVRALYYLRYSFSLISRVSRLPSPTNRFASWSQGTSLPRALVLVLVSVRGPRCMPVDYFCGRCMRLDLASVRPSFS